MIIFFVLGVVFLGGGVLEIVDVFEEEVVDEVCLGIEGVGVGVSVGVGVVGGGIDIVVDFDVFMGLGVVGWVCLGDIGVGNGVVDVGVLV